jgi:hypothetical protein
MDPNANLKEQTRLVQQIRYNADNNIHTPTDLFERLVDLVEAMTEWLNKGGALPDDWRSNGRK